MTLVLALAACGGPSGPPIPQATGVTPSVAERGDTITVAGTGFGQDGTVTIGGAVATPTSWSDTSIEVQVPAGAANAWGDVEVVTAGGSTTVEDLFVGAEFEGAAAELQAFLDGLELGTAVLLQAQTYDLTAEPDEFIIDNRDIYGRGEAETTILGPATGVLIVLADFGSTLTIADLTIVGDDFTFFHGTVSDTILPTVAAAREPVPTTLEALMERRWVVNEVGPAAVGRSNIQLQRFTFEADAPGALIGNLGSNLPNVSLSLEDVTFDLPGGGLALVTNGDIEAQRTSVVADMIQALTVTGAMSIVDSSVTVEGMAVYAANDGLEVSQSELRVTNGLQIMAGHANTLMGGSTLPLGGPVTITDSVIEVLDADLADASDVGSFQVITQFAPITLRGNPLIRTHGDLTIVSIESDLGEGDIDLVGNLDMRVGVFEAEDAVNHRVSKLGIATNAASLRDRTTISG
ncbi:MAG TPA: IPT/TIG domain-containing protein, partial [Trueperaceae bacterium]|nr:IPT/TIG domain-containing protein [Trueperaceae bacterium]